MKNYFSFNQTGGKLFPAWISLYIVLIAFFATMAFFVMALIPKGTPPSPKLAFLFLFVFLALFITVFFMYFFFIKFCVEGISYKDKTLEFTGTPMGFLGTVVLGIILTIFTLGIYSAWFIRDLYRFFINNTYYDSEKFEFQGRGWELFGILLVTVLVPFIVFFMLGFKMLLSMATMGFINRILFQTVETLIFIPYVYFYYKWVFDIKFKNYLINWRTDTVSALLKIIQEQLLAVITLYIYFPLAWVRLYKYFVDRTVAESPEQKINFGFDSTDKEDFILIWKETLLSIVTLGIYLPWAICNINKRILGKTFTEAVETPL